MDGTAILMLEDSLKCLFAQWDGMLIVLCQLYHLSRQSSAYLKGEGVLNGSFPEENVILNKQEKFYLYMHAPF